VIATGEECVNLNRKALAQMASGQVREAESSLSAALAANAGGLDRSCIGVVLNNMAAAASVSGRLAEAERLAGRAINTLEESYPLDDPVMLRPLQILIGARLAQHEMTKARAAFSRMQSIRTGSPADRALIHGSKAALLEMEGRWTEAESELRVSIAAWQEAGRGTSADTGSAFNALASLYQKEQRWGDAAEALNQALSIFTQAKDTVPMDKVKLLNDRAVIRARQGEYREAARDLEEAMSLVDRESGPDPVVLRSLLINYGYVLRKSHRQREAVLAEARLTALRNRWGGDGVVDASELIAAKKAHRK